MAPVLIVFTILYLNLVSCTLTDIFWTPRRLTRQVPVELQNVTESGLGTHSNSTTQRSPYQDVNFWVLRADESPTESTSESNLQNESTTSVESTTVKNEGNTAPPMEVQLDEPWQAYEMNQLIFLNRNNCNLEIQISEAHDMKMKVMYESLQNGMIGECQIALRGKSGIFLAVLITDVQLSVAKDGRGRNVSNEILRIMTRTNHFNFTLVEYRGWEQYYPVVLTDSDQAFIVLSYHGITSSKRTSGFNLEVFNYYKNENAMNSALNDNPNSSYGNSQIRVEDIYITTDIP